MAGDLTVPAIVGLLAGDVLRLVDALGLVGKLQRNGEFQCLPKKQGGQGRSFLVCAHGAKAGVWAHHAAARAGDALDLIQYVRQCDKADAVRWAKGFLGLAGDYERSSPAAPAAAAADLEAARREAENKAEEMRQAALRIWGEAIDATGTLAQIYLRRRGYHGAMPITIRFHRGLRHPDTDRAVRWPCLVAARTFGDETSARIGGIWRIYLDRDGNKAPVDPARVKMGLGSVRGGAVRLSPRRPRINTGEGLETCLGVLQNIPDACVWAALSTTGLAEMQWPPGTEELVIWDDFDPRVATPGPMQGKRPGFVASQRLGERARQGGLRVAFVHPGTGEGTDFADVFRMGDQ